MLEKFYRVFNFVIIVFIIGLTVGSIFIQDHNRNANQKVLSVIDDLDSDKLKNIGYTKEEINVVKNNKDLIKIILTKKYNKKIISLASIKGFKNKHLDAYLKYYDNNHTLTPEQVVISVNNQK